MMRILRIFAPLAVLLAFALAAAPVSAAGIVPISQATESAAGARWGVPQNCPNTSGCFYVDWNFQTGEGWEIYPARAAGTCENATLNDQYTSHYNKSGKGYIIYEHANCQGRYRTFLNGAGSQTMVLDNVTPRYSGESLPNWSDRVSSIKWCNCG